MSYNLNTSEAEALLSTTKTKRRLSLALLHGAERVSIGVQARVLWLDFGDSKAKELTHELQLNSRQREQIRKILKDHDNG